MVSAIIDELQRAGIDQIPEAVAADAGYGNEDHMDEVVAHKHMPVLVSPEKASRGTPRKTGQGAALNGCERSSDQNTAGSATENEDIRSSRSSATPNTSKGVTWFLRRGRVKVRTEWRLLMMTQNLGKLHRHQLAVTGA
jgi:hypothetical protein